MYTRGLGTTDILNQLSFYLQGPLSSNHLKVFSELVHTRLHVVAVSLKNPTFLFE